jgi:hypothetical protein
MKWFTAGLFRYLVERETGKTGLNLRLNKYNPIYNLQSMMPRPENDKLRLRGNMANKKDEHSKSNQGALSSSAHGGFYEIHVKGQLDDSWTDWMEDLEMKLLDNGEMILSGRIRDQAALMGILNKLYGLNLTLRSVNEVSPNNV